MFKVKRNIAKFEKIAMVKAQLFYETYTSVKFNPQEMSPKSNELMDKVFQYANVRHMAKMERENAVLVMTIVNVGDNIIRYMDFWSIEEFANNFTFPS